METHIRPSGRVCTPGSRYQQAITGLDKGITIISMPRCCNYHPPIINKGRDAPAIAEPRFYIAAWLWSADDHSVKGEATVCIIQSRAHKLQHDLRNGRSRECMSTASTGGVCTSYPIIKGGGLRIICVLTGKPEKWLHYRVGSLRQYKQAG
jgi:hypothetical protein